MCPVQAIRDVLEHEFLIHLPAHPSLQQRLEEIARRGA